MQGWGAMRAWQHCWRTRRYAHAAGLPTCHVWMPHSNVLNLYAADPLAAALDHILGAVGDLPRLRNKLL